MVQEDEADLERLNFDLEALAGERMAKLAHNRLCLTRVNRVLSPDNPDLARMAELATVGITINVDPTFVPNTSPDAPGPFMRTVRLDRHTCRVPSRHAVSQLGTPTFQEIWPRRDVHPLRGRYLGNLSGR